MLKVRHFLLLLVCIGGLQACGGTKFDGAPANSSSGLPNSAISSAGAKNSDASVNTSAVSASAANNALGANLYSEQCAVCHGVTGKGTAAGNNLESCSTCGNFQVLASRIETTMPLGSPTKCGADCSKAVATYILENFSTIYKSSSRSSSLSQSSATSTSSAISQSSNSVPNVQTGASIYQLQCSGCHGVNGSGGIGGNSILQCANCGSLEQLTKVINDTMPYGSAARCVGSCAVDVSAYLLGVLGAGVATSSSSSASSVQPKIVKLKTLPETLRKFSITVVNRLPTDAEYALSETEAGFDQVIKTMMGEKEFGLWIKVTFNDLLLTDKYNYDTEFKASDMIRASDYATTSGLEGIMSPYVEDNVYFDSRCASKIMEYSIAQEPLELVRYIANNDRSINEIITANYRMVNFYTQKGAYHGRRLDGKPFSSSDFRYIDFVLTRDKNHFCNEYQYQNLTIPPEGYFYYDIDHFVPAIISRALSGSTGKNPPTLVYDENAPLPLAGVLTSEMFLERYDTNNTNRNRQRAATVFKYFLDTDVGASQVDNFDSAGYKIPVMQDPNCTGCHNLIDPVASSFRNWDRYGQYMSPNHTYTGDTGAIRQQKAQFPLWDQTGMLPPGFNGATAPDLTRPLSWLAAQIVSDERRYRSAIIRTLYQGLLGPYDNPDYYRSLYDKFKAKGVDTEKIKSLVLALIKLDDYRIDGVIQDGVGYDNIQSSRILSAEMLNRKIKSLLGLRWFTLQNKSVRVLFGGIDSDAFTTRLDKINGVSEAFSERMASEMACYSVSNDFANNTDSRLLFRYVDKQDRPENAEAISRIRQNIRYLHERLLGEKLALDDEKISATYDLFLAVYTKYKTSNNKTLADACKATFDRDYEPQRGRYRVWIADDRQITNDNYYTIKAWMAVVNYMLLDFKFLHE